jgi:hypothetical protein
MKADLKVVMMVARMGSPMADSMDWRKAVHSVVK